jgi:O-methyltransferase
MTIEEKLLATYPREKPGMMSVCQIKHILRNLRIVLESGIAGDVVELGCHAGTTSLFIRRLLDHYRAGRCFHVYDSWRGLPEKDEKDGNTSFRPGQCETAKEKFVDNFRKWNLELPHIHSGWFQDIPDEEYPERIAFAYFDGDFYRSVMASFNKVYFKLSPDARLVIDDYEHPQLPGCPRACRDFLKDKPEEVEILKDDTGRASLGLMIKK